VNDGLLYLGVTQAQTPVGIRERLVADRAGRRALGARLTRNAEGVLLLATCERFEVYLSNPGREVPHWIGLLSAEFGFSQSALAGYVRVEHGARAARHLLRVAAGLESRQLGEGNILRQVRAAYLEGLADATLGPQLCALGRSAICTGKRVRRFTALGTGADKTVKLALDRLRAHAPPEDRPHLLILGTGALAKSALAGATNYRGTRAERRVRCADQHPADRTGTHWQRITVVSRSAERAADLAGRYGVTAARLDALPQLVAGADAVLACSTAHAGFLVHHRTLRNRRARPLRLVDLGVPRNIDPDVAVLPNVTVTHLEQLHAFASAPASAITSAEALVARELVRFERWQQARAHRDRIRAWTAGPLTRAQQRAVHERIEQLKRTVAA
jgi:glutamyl-tRNA reductase